MYKKHQRHYKIKRTIIGIFTFLLLLMVYFFKEANLFLRVITAVALLVFFYSVDHFFDIRFRAKHYFYIFIIAICGVLLSSFYYLYPNYDKILHFFQPILISSIIFHMVSLLRLKMKWKIIFTLFIVSGIVGVFEIGEYSLDKLFDMKLQGVYLRDYKGLEKLNLIMDPIDDTMIDLLFGYLGTISYGLFIYLTTKINLGLSFRPNKKNL